MKLLIYTKFMVIGVVFTFLFLYGIYSYISIYGFRIWGGHPKIDDPTSMILYWKDNVDILFESYRTDTPLEFDKNTAIKCGKLINQGKVLGQWKQGMDCELEFLFEDSKPIRYELSFQGYVRHSNAYCIKIEQEKICQLLLLGTAQSERCTPANVENCPQNQYPTPTRGIVKNKIP